MKETRPVPTEPTEVPPLFLKLGMSLVLPEPIADILNLSLQSQLFPTLLWKNINDFIKYQMTLAKHLITLNHKLLIEKLIFEFDLSSELVLILHDYLKDRQVKIKINDIISNPFKVESGVPQGSILGPITLYYVCK
jgi:hypothetical protein